MVDDIGRSDLSGRLGKREAFIRGLSDAEALDFFSQRW